MPVYQAVTDEVGRRLGVETELVVETDRAACEMRAACEAAGFMRLR